MSLSLVLLLALGLALVAVWSAIGFRLGTVIGGAIVARDRQIPTDRNRGW